MKELLRKILKKIYFLVFPPVPPVNNVCTSGENSMVHLEARINNLSNDPANIIIGANTHVLGHLTVWANAGKIIVGDFCYIGEETRIFSVKSVKIGNRVQIAHGCNIFDNNVHSIDPEERHLEYIQNIESGSVKQFDLKEKEVIIEDDAWLGACVIILKGITIGKGAIVGAGSVVTQNIPDYTIAAGNPARIVRTINR